LLIETALIAAPNRGNNPIFGRPLLERLMINCERAGVKRFVIAAPSGSHPELSRAMGRFRDRDSVSIVESFADVMSRNNGHAPIDPSAPCVAFSGNLVFAKSHLARILDAHAPIPNRSIERKAPIAIAEVRSLPDRSVRSSMQVALPAG